MNQEELVWLGFQLVKVFALLAIALCYWYLEIYKKK